MPSYVVDGSNLVRDGRATPEEGIAHVRDYCLPGAENGVAHIEARNAESPPLTGSVGQRMLPRAIARRDELQAFLDKYDALSQHTTSEGGSE